MLAIIIPYFKINFFEKTLESLAQQTDQRFQVYIGDDASPDSPVELLEKYEGKFNFTYQKFEKNLGSISLTKQWERCIEMMQEEEWFMILGDDDVLSDNVVEAFYGNFAEAEQNTNVIRLAYSQIDEMGKTGALNFSHAKYQSALDAYIEKLNGKTYTSLSQFIFKNSIFKKYGFHDLNLAWGSDDYAVLQCAEEKPLFSIPEKVYVRMSAFNISGDKLLQKEKESSLFQLFGLLLKTIKMTKKQAYNIADAQFNMLMKKNDKIEIVKFLFFIFGKIELGAFVYFLKVSVRKLSFQQE